jgi:hypothetical protein
MRVLFFSVSNGDSSGDDNSSCGSSSMLMLGGLRLTHLIANSTVIAAIAGMLKVILYSNTHSRDVIL